MGGSTQATLALLGPDETQKRAASVNAPAVACALLLLIAMAQHGLFGKRRMVDDSAIV